jgi:hypothetical protein
VPDFALGGFWAGKEGPGGDAASEFTVSSDFAKLEEELFAGEEVAVIGSSAPLSLLPFLGNFRENPAGTKRSINSKSPRMRIISRMMN